ncbi:Cysteine-rich receptor-kinase-like protein [Quillaja saponaria]|uniref:Cysteine-rich receptor-kinase-like protein n=1 Tax=Quillaja saponaria TaxID=32244 RepID=A0AAD7LZF2_QUISA|nr:Cysteine-rich receptor-kinase-like protein [Quillaja saponaria]
MLSSILRLFPSLFLILITQTTAQPKFQYQFCRTDEGNYTANSTYKANLNTLLSNLTSNIEIDYGFYNSSHGQNSDKVYAVGLCRGDVKPDDCRSCLNDTIVLLPKVCPNQKEAIAGYDNCMLRYSNQSLYGILETRPSFLLGSGDNATDPDRFNQATRELLESLRSRAASGNSNLRKYAAGNATGPNFQTIFALVQCTPDLSEQECTDCLVRAFSDIKGSNILGERGGRIIKPSCNFRYENSRFYDPTIDTQPPPPPPSTNTTSKGGEVDQDLEIGSTESLQLDFGTISVATDNFSDSNKLGQGGFGAVYKGRLSNGQEIAVKRLSRESHQGDLEFKNEVLLLAKLQHRNLVRLLGFCLEGGEKLLIYEFMPKKSLEYLLFGIVPTYV